MPRGEERAISPATGAVPAPTAGESTLLTADAVNKAEAVASLHRELRLAALKVTTAKDWVDLDGQPYLSASGCHRLAALFKVRQRNVRTERLTEPDGSFTIVVIAEACSEVLDSGGWVEVVGTASSSDRFLTKGGKVRPAFGDVLKKAHTNWFGRAIRQLVGLNGLTWQELEALGISREHAPKVQFAQPAEDAGDLVWVEVPYKDKDRFRDLVRNLWGHPPRWDGQTKKWGVPREVAESPEVRQLTGGLPEAETLFGGGK